MLKWKRIAKDFISISVSTEYDGKPLYWTSFYYYKGLIVDTGCPHTAEEAANFIENMKLSIKAVLLTHYHEDHSGGAHLFKERFDAEVLAPRNSLEILSKPPEIPAYRQMVWGQPKPVSASPLNGKTEFDGVTVVTFETPGHSFDHVSFLTDNLIFTGDLVTNPVPIITMGEEDSLRLIDSLKTIVDLDFEAAYGGHGVWDKSGISETLNNMIELKQKIQMLSRSGLNVEEILREVFMNTPKKVLLMEEMSEGEWSRKNLVESILGIKHKPPSSLPPKSNVN
jgi:glyoxylase-like metal-dependent hydrolase (beta-lactamase superfamily II)